MSMFLKRMRLRIEDLFRVMGFSTVRSVFRYLAYIRAKEPKLRLTVASDAITHAPRLTRALGAWHVAESAAKEVINKKPQVGSTELRRSALIKKPVLGTERGILLVSFEDELMKLAELRKLPQLECEYQILFLPTWQPFHSPALFLFKERTEKVHALMPSSLEREKKLVPDFSRRFVYLPFHAASWVSKERIASGAEKRDIDFLMVANFARHKRHWKLFEMVKKLPSDAKVVVAGMPRGKRDLQALQEEAALFGVRDRIEFYAAPSDETISNLFSRARVFCAMTHKEGSYISVVEALMHGVSVAMFRNALIGSRVYLDVSNGRFLSYFGDSASQLERLRAHHDPMRITRWASQNISAEVNCCSLNQLLREQAFSSNCEWSQDIEPFYCSHFEFSYSRGQDAEAEFESEYERLRKEYGLSVYRAH